MQFSVDLDLLQIAFKPVHAVVGRSTKLDELFGLLLVEPLQKLWQSRGAIIVQFKQVMRCLICITKRAVGFGNQYG